MGSKPSRVKGTVVAVPGTEKVCHTPKQELTASAPPTPQRPDGAPRPPTRESQEEDNPQDAPTASASAADLTAAGRGDGAARAAPARGPVRQTHSGVGTWEAEPAAGAADPVAAAAVAAAAVAQPGEAAAGDGGGAAAAAAAAAAPAAGGAASEHLRFDLPLEEVLALATEAFGSIAAALSSPKWDRRVQALKGVGTVLKGLDIRTTAGASSATTSQAELQQRSSKGLQLRDGKRCFRAACLILNIALRDKVLPVLFAAHELYRITFEHGQSSVPEAEASFAMAKLLEHILAKLGEVNIKMHESACVAFVFSTDRAPRMGLAVAFARLRQHLDESQTRGLQRMRVHAGVLDVVGQLLRRFPGRREGEGDESDASAAWSPSDVAPFVVGGATADAVMGARVQQAAASLAVTVYTTLGRRSLDVVMTDMPEAAKEMILQKIEEETGDVAEDGDCEDLEDEVGGGEDIPPGAAQGLDLCITGVAIKAPARAQLTKTDGKEENFMDEILEETGLVFQGQGLKTVPGQANKDSFASNPLDEDLRSLGLLDGAGGCLS